MPARWRVTLACGALPVPFGRSPSLQSAQLLTLCSGTDGKRQCSLGRLGGLGGYVAATVGDRIDQPFLTQDSHRTPRRSPGDLELFNQLALGWYPSVRSVPARVDTPTKDLRDLPVRRNRGDRVNTVSTPVCHSNNFSCAGLTSHTVIWTESASDVCRQVDTRSRSLLDAGRVVRSLFGAQPFPATLSAADREPRARVGATTCAARGIHDEH
jgi:hypothetical protein